jgi:hypothetical protein
MPYNVEEDEHKSARTRVSLWTTERALATFAALYRAYPISATRIIGEINSEEHSKRVETRRRMNHV